MKKFDPKLCNEIFVRLLLVFVYKVIGLFEPIERIIQPEEIWMYRYPVTKSYCSINCLWTVIFVVTFLIVLTCYIIKSDSKDVEASILAVTLSISLTATLTRLIKIVTGKPRPDFFYRCFPSGYANEKMICNGNKQKINDGRQSFPSGHAALSFSGLGFISLYLLGKLRVYELKGKGHSWRMLVCLFPVLLASLVGISRTCDYHHHAIDVLAGTLLGSFMTIISYHQYFPPFYSPSCDVPYAVQTKE